MLTNMNSLRNQHTYLQSSGFSAWTKEFSTNKFLSTITPSPIILPAVILLLDFIVQLGPTILCDITTWSLILLPENMKEFCIVTSLPTEIP